MFYNFLQNSKIFCPNKFFRVFVSNFRLGGYTVVLKSEGAVREHQADVLGVYRMVDSYNERPVYKQDGGENYIYYRYYRQIFYFCLMNIILETTS
jgi:hypothetical protein